MEKGNKPKNFEEFMSQFQESAKQDQEVEQPKQESEDDSLITEEGDQLDQEEVVEDVDNGEVEPQEDATETEEEDSNESDQSSDESDESEDEDEDLSFDDWDDVEVEEEAKEEPEVNFSEIAKELGFEEVSNREELVEAISNIKKEAEELRVKSETYSTIPDDLKEAIELHKKGGDYLSYLGITSNDYSQYSDRDLVANSIANHFKNEDGSINEEELQEYIDGMGDKDVKIQGSKIRENLINSQKSQKLQLEQKAEQARKEQGAHLKKALSSMDKIDNFKVNSNHKKDLYNKIMKGDMLKDLFYDGKGQLDYSKVAKVYFRELNRDKINKFYETKIKNNTRKEVWRSTTNTQLDKPSTKPSPDNKAKSAMDSYMEQLTKR